MSKKLGFLFPGQGSQSVGMGTPALSRNSSLMSYFEEANRQMGYSLSALCLDGPEEKLKQTENTQPALYVTSIMTLRVLEDSGIHPHAVAGHSLGEYTALCAAGVFTFEEGFSLVRQRGIAYAEAGKHRPGSMAAILGLPIEEVRRICDEASRENSIVVPANINEPTQTVISGDPPAVERACVLAKEANAKRALPLPVSGAFHSPLVEPASQTMKEALSPIEFQKPKALFVNNVDAKVLENPQEIKDSLIRQITGSVRWVEVVEKLIGEGCTAFVEVGAGKALSGLVRRINKDIPCYTTESIESLQKTIEILTSE